MIECPKIDRDNIQMDPSGYWFLIRPNFRYGFIEAALCHREFGDQTMDGKYIVDIFSGASAQDIYTEILTDKPYVTLMTHAAYLGKELKKCELALALGIKGHYQE